MIRNSSAYSYDFQIARGFPTPIHPLQIHERIGPHRSSLPLSTNFQPLSHYVRFAPTMRVLFPLPPLADKLTHTHTPHVFSPGPCAPAS